ncbi:MAG: RNA polymerase factor sigma-54 [Muribaculaceae bacterium]|nr:RNA polymerase factor sigma-54 [Muribaculaceae bacterium]
MDDSLQIQQTTGLRQRLAPQQVIFGRYLEMTAPEIEDEVRRALDENPALEERESAPEESIDNKDDDGGEFNESAEELQRADYRDDDDAPAYRYNAGNHSPDDGYTEPVAIDDNHSIIDVLESQLADFDLSDRDRDIARYIIGNIDGNGYLGRSLASIADDISIATGRDTSDNDVRRVADTIRAMDPAGVGAFDLRDCLLLQLRRLNPSEAVDNAVCIVRDYFDLFSKRHYDRMASRAKLSETALREALDVIHSLNPKPGALIEQSNSGDRLRHIVPDFTVEVENGRASVSLNGHIPELAISESFIPDEKKPSDNRRAREARAFIRARHDEAQMLIRMVNSRAETLLSVMKAIVRLQLRFFESGNSADIRPMILKDVAELTGYDLSVISRATAGKYVATPGGVFPLKMLFNERRKEDSDTSAHEILDVISQMIAEEDKRSPLTDEAIKDRLNTLGYDIARRTVAKYREQLDLPVARLRRTF